MTHSPADDPTFFRPILARFADDGPRLILADFLEESARASDHARAELIRVQVALARLPRDHPRREELSGAERHLLEEHQEEWTAPFRAWADGFGFRRGLIESVIVDARQFLAQGAELLRRLPVRRVRLSGVNAALPQLVGSPLLEAISELDLCGSELGDGGIRYLLQSRYLTRIRVLDLSISGISDTGVRVMAQAATMPRLRQLFLAENERITSDGLAALAESAGMARLTRLDVSGNSIDDAGLRAMMRSPHRARLRSFQIDANAISDEGLQAFATSELLAHLLRHDSHLSLTRNQIGPEGMIALAASPLAEAVTRLSMGQNFLGDAGVAAIGFAPHFIRLRKLAVDGNQITDDGVIALAHSPLMSRLLWLNLEKNRITGKGVDVLLANGSSWKCALEMAGNYASEHLFPELGEPIRRKVRLTRAALARILRRTVPPAFLDQADHLRD
ncbi:MAG: TIGR02996 domain-containing protein [Bacteroidales bacterium]|nr:TIGR02996 domain-containing protein [Bacteroidales bacterium]